jgi:cytochrome c oxidase cbb3-type subunit 3
MGNARTVRIWTAATQVAALASRGASLDRGRRLAPPRGERRLASPQSRWFAVAILLLLAIACRREQRIIRHSPPASDRAPGIVRLSELQPGKPAPEIYARNLAEERAYDVSEGKRLFAAYNCKGCHANGGGGMGPALMDEYWIYGSQPENVHDTILKGRPNGMPSFEGKIPDYQVWELTAYVRSLSGLTPKLAAPARDDHLMAKVAEQSKKEE